ncbi:MAG: ThiS family [Blastocatellia bacterium]|nr:ThiS family [Blastocatellia bacterium]
MLSDLVHELSLAPARIAIEVNQRVIRRDQWQRTALAEDDRIEIVHFVGGGEADRGHPFCQRALHAWID